MKKILLIILLIPSLSFAQQGEWTWMKGANVSGQWGNYGTKGVESPSNVPGARYESGGMRDKQNNFWLFGGAGYDYKGSLGTLTDFWKYNTSTNNWTWISGDSITLQQGVYGTEGVPSPTNKPGQRYAFVTWDELNGFLWMWGGNSYNDLWRYDLTSGEWTWMTGSNTGGAIGIYGTKGIPSATNTPGARGEITCSWTDSKGNLWLFGGAGNAASNSYGMLNDLWMYNPTTNEWTWESGDNIINQAGVYGTLGVAAAGNKPGGRFAYNCWVDSADNLWLFAGNNSSASTYYNDLWKYNIASGQWTWMSGSNTGVNGNTGANYGTECVGDSLNIPSRRFENKADWVDACGNFWSYGGANAVGDLWVYSPSTHKWTWTSGDNTINTNPVYGIQGVANPANKPGARYGSPSWKSSDGTLWMFGGAFNGGTYRNDLWKFVIDTANCIPCASVVAPPTASFLASDTTLCANDCITFTNLSTNATSWSWSFQGATPSSSSDENPFVCYQSAGNFSVELIAYGSGGTDSLALTNYIAVNPSPPTPTIIQSNDTLYCSFDSTYTSYQWYKDSVLVSGATNSSYYVTESGNYNIRVGNVYGCSIAVGINVTVTGLNLFTDGNNELTVSPNPVNDLLTISTGTKLKSQNSKLIIYNVLGENIYEAFVNSSQTVINVSSFSPGVYFIQLSDTDQKWMKRFIKE